jgi:adenylate cyclase
LGSRLEGLSKVYGVDLVVSESTKKLAPGFVWQELDRVRVKGREQPVTLFEPLCSMVDGSEALQQELAAHTQALVAYRAGDWPLAEARFGDLAARHPNQPLYKLYLSRIATLRIYPPILHWDGVFNLTEK